MHVEKIVEVCARCTEGGVPDLELQQALDLDGHTLHPFGVDAVTEGRVAAPVVFA